MLKTNCEGYLVPRLLIQCELCGLFILVSSLVSAPFIVRLKCNLSPFILYALVYWDLSLVFSFTLKIMLHNMYAFVYVCILTYNVCCRNRRKKHNHKQYYRASSLVQIKENWPKLENLGLFVEPTHIHTYMNLCTYTAYI